jgi:HEAT repeat protein
MKGRLGRLAGGPEPWIGGAMRHSATLCLTITLLGLLLVSEAPGQDPRYLGKTLLEWTDGTREASPRGRLQAMEALAHFGALAAPILADGLADPDIEVSVEAAKSLGTIPDAAPHAEKALARALTQGPPRLRRVAARVLGRIGPLTGPGTAALIEALADGDPQVWDNAASSLQTIGAADLPAVLGALKRVEPKVRLGAAIVLSALVRSGRIAPDAWTAIVPALVEAAVDPEFTVRNEVVHALGASGKRGEPAAAVLSNIAQHDPDEGVRREASHALTEIRGRSDPGR